jgi:hypothetical protein
VPPEAVPPGARTRHAIAVQLDAHSAPLTQRGGSARVMGLQ